MGRLTERGRQLHRDWVTEVFGSLAGRDERTVDLLVVATDVYTWKLLRLDLGLSQADTNRTLVELIDKLKGEL